MGEIHPDFRPIRSTADFSTRSDCARPLVSEGPNFLYLLDPLLMKFQLLIITSILELF